MFRDAAIVTGRLSGTKRGNDGTFYLEQRYIRVYVKRNDRWQSVTKSIYILAELHQAANDYQAAEQMYRRLLATWDKAQHPMNSEFSLALGRYGCLLRKNKRRDEAEKLEIRPYGIPVGEAYDKIQSTAIPPFRKIENGKTLNMPRPSYPKKAKQAGIYGTVHVRVVIDEEAKVILACAVSGNAFLAAAVEQAAYRARFTPTVVNDKPVKITGVVTYTFIKD